MTEQETRDSERDAIVAWLATIAASFHKAATKLELADDPAIGESLETCKMIGDAIQSNEHRKGE